MEQWMESLWENGGAIKNFSISKEILDEHTRFLPFESIWELPLNRVEHLHLSYASAAAWMNNHIETGCIR